MTENELKQTWKNTIVPFAVWIVLFIVSVLYNTYGIKNSTLETVSLFASICSLTFIIFYSIKIVKFRKILKQLNEN
ncbi:hypothetical protein [Psychroserpens sp.]